MVGKGRKRREKNYRAAHGVDRNRLPPPPEPSKIDALPSKLRKLISLGTSNDEVPGGGERKGNRNKGNKGTEDVLDTQGVEKKEKKTRKRKRPQVEDLRFEADGNNHLGQKRRERKKKYLETKRNKKQKRATDLEESFPGLENVKFGEVVQAPPKLLSVPKVPKNPQDAYKERLRSQTIEAYRSRKGWTNRPGIKLPTLDLAPSL